MHLQLRDEQTVFLNDITPRARELAARFQSAAELEKVFDRSARGVLEDLSIQRLSLMDEVDEALRAEGGLPKGEDPEKELIESLADRWVAGFSGPAALLSRLVIADSELLKLIEEAEVEQWSETMSGLLAGLAHQLRETETALRKLQLEIKSRPA